MTSALVARTLVALTLLAPVAAQAGCGAGPAPCAVAGGTYHIVFLSTPGPHPAVVFLQGWGGSGLGALSNSEMVDPLLAHSSAVIASNGQPREGRPPQSQTWPQLGF